MKSIIEQGLALQAASIGKKLPKAKKVNLWDEFDPETHEPKDWVADNHVMTREEELDSPTHGQGTK